MIPICWQTDINSLTPEEMLRRYERGWHYLGIIGELSAEEAEFVRQLSQRYGSWIVMNFQLEQHRQILQVLSRLNASFLKDCGAYFGDGTFLSLKYDEYRLSKDIDFLCSAGQGYRAIREQVFDRRNSPKRDRQSRKCLSCHRTIETSDRQFPNPAKLSRTLLQIADD